MRFRNRGEFSLVATGTTMERDASVSVGVKIGTRWLVGEPEGRIAVRRVALWAKRRGQPFEAPLVGLPGPNTARLDRNPIRGPQTIAHEHVR